VRVLRYIVAQTDAEKKLWSRPNSLASPQCALVARAAVASSNRSGRATRKKYIPSEKQRAQDQRIKDKLDHLTGADLKKFDQVLRKAIKST